MSRFVDDGEGRYLQRNSAIADDLSGLGNALEDMAKPGINMAYTDNHIVLKENDGRNGWPISRY
ncbi:hypothetical protein [Photobacterium lipolyticum]|uniref:hypothetical protein n=1 Tax=Photobacterium lipolyticum TaxID=266810 RepID=UPI001B874432|nr:hypothetical protein [Photobacterium lipolyticum]